MIFDQFIIIGSAFITVIYSVFGVINLAIPNGISNAVTTFVGYLYMFEGVFPVSSLITSMVFISTVYFFLYVVKIGLWVFAFIPFIGKNNPLPTQNARMDSSGHVSRFINFKKKK